MAVKRQVKVASLIGEIVNISVIWVCGLYNSIYFTVVWRNAEKLWRKKSPDMLICCSS